MEFRKHRFPWAWKKYLTLWFTLVELIVVITILAILATVGFLTLSGYTDDARSATVATNVRTVYSAILTESTTSGNSPRYYVDHDPAAALTGGTIVVVDGNPVVLTGGQFGSGGTNYSAGNPFWDRLRMNGEKFRLASAFGISGYGSFPDLANRADAAYVTGSVVVGALDYWKMGQNGKLRNFPLFQVAGISPSTKKATVIGSAFQYGTGAAMGLVDNPASSAASDAIVDSAVLSSGMAGVSGTCSWLPANAAYFWNVLTYGLNSAPPGTGLSATYAATPTANTCEFSCAAGYVWNPGTSACVLPPSGEQVYVVPWTYSWTVPAGVTSVSFVCVGGGGGGGGDSGSGPGGGGGGGLVYGNNVAVTPGSTISVVIGNGWSAGGAGGNGGTGGNSSFGSAIAYGGGGWFASLTAWNGGGFSGGSGGFSGGNGGAGTSSQWQAGSNGGGSGNVGAGGGGAGGHASGNTALASGAGGGTLGGGGTSYSCAGQGAGGGSLGTGYPGIASVAYTANGSMGGPGAVYGGGGGGGAHSTAGGPGGTGGCRIVYPGATRSFPGS